MTEKDGGEKQEFTPPATQEALDQIIKDRIARERNKFADYDDLKSKAEKLDQLEASNKSELEKAVARAEQAEAKIKAFEQKEQIASWKLEISKTTGVPADALAGSTQDELAAHAEILKGLLKPVEGAPLSPVILGQEKSPSNPQADPELGFVKDFFK